MKTHQLALNRRRFVACFSSEGARMALMPGALVAVAQDAEVITLPMLEAAQAIAGISFTRQEQERIVDRRNGARDLRPAFETLRASALGNETQPAFVFNPVPPGEKLPTERKTFRRRARSISMPLTDEALAYLPETHLARLVETRQVTSTELTKLYLERLRRYDPQIRAVVTLTEDLALRQARQADEEIAAGNYRGPLHGIPWGAKDLLAVRGTTTTWGMSPYVDRVIDADATVFNRLTEAGAVLVAKLSTGALAVSARWFGGTTRNPWNLEQDASGSSAGPGAATAAGLVGFSIGTDTGGSIILPSTRNGVTGLRPTFGRVSRYGVMSLVWTQDTVGPMCRSAEDCALVLDAIQGPDGRDNTLLDVPFNWDAEDDVSQLRVGYLRSLFDGDLPDEPTRAERQQQIRDNAEEALRVIRSLGVEVVPFDLPDVPIETIDFMRYVETAAAFDEETRTGVLTEVENGPEESRRPDEIRAARFTPAVEFVQGNRLRMRAMEQMAEAMADVDLFIGSHQALTNRTGHPVMSLPNGFFEGTPTALHLTGALFGESAILRLADAFQAVTNHHERYPPL